MGDIVGVASGAAGVEKVESGVKVAV